MPAKGTKNGDCKYKGCEGCDPASCPGQRKCKASADVYKTLHAEELRAKRAAYNAAHREENIAKCKAYRTANAEKQRLYNATYKATHAEEIKPKVAAYNKTHTKEKSMYNAIYAEAHAEDKRAYDANRRPKVGPIKGYLMPNGTFVRCHSMPEARLALALIDEGIEVQRLVPTYTTPMGEYTPDFYLPRYNLYIEVKAYRGRPQYLQRKAEQLVKIQYLRSQGINIAYTAAEDIEAELA